mgnify:CR=1 FL=1
MSKGTSKFAISQRLRTLMCLVGQAVVFEEGCELIKELMGVEIGSSQLQRVCTYYGKQVDALIKANCESIIPRLESAQHTPDSAYVMMDGSMIFTTEHEWRELKLGRVFYDHQVVTIHPKRREVIQSVYVGHLGSVADFFPKLERHLVGYRKKVIIGDGAKWIWNWAEDNYPGAVQILDFFHAKEKLVIFARHQFKQEQARQDWLKDQTDSLLDNQLEQVLVSLRSCRARNTEAKLAKQKAIDYYIEHEDRMQYRTYREQGLMIGSGPIEAAHRSVIQQRMKLSGQKWSITGAQAITNLRCYKHSHAWDKIKKIITAAA